MNEMNEPRKNETNEKHLTLDTTEQGWNQTFGKLLDRNLKNCIIVCLLDGWTKIILDLDFRRKQRIPIIVCVCV